MASLMDVGGLPNHVKYYISVFSFQWTNIRISPVGIPFNWYQSWWFKVVFDFCSKMKVVKIVFWPYHYVEEEETKPLVKTASKSNVGHGHTRHHAPVSHLPTRADAPHASSSPGWANPTHVTDPDKDDINMNSACHVSDQSADTSAQWDPLATS